MICCIFQCLDVVVRDLVQGWSVTVCDAFNSGVWPKSSTEWTSSEYRLRYHYDVSGTHREVVLHASLLQEVLDAHRNLDFLAVDDPDHLGAVPGREIIEAADVDHHVQQRHVALVG